MAVSSKRTAHKITTSAFSHILENKRIQKTPALLAQYMKGVANHRRVEILMYLAKNKNVTLEQISGKLDCNFKTISGHTQKLVNSGLINKRYIGQNVLHSLTPQGTALHSFLSSFWYSREYKNKICTRHNKHTKTKAARTSSEGSDPDTARLFC